ncbi:MAG: 6-phosphogluconolactonase [Nitrospirae bacterium]|nr:6-phosphogluconolactonase [Nitrospirota bacterium]
MKVRVLQNLEAISREAAAVFKVAAKNCIALKGSFAAALSGGSTPRRFYTLLGSEKYIEKIDWSCVHLFWADERCVSKEHEDSNFRVAFETFISKVPLPASGIHRIKGEKEPEDAAMEYEDEIKGFFGKKALPVFDLIILGVGEDGHTASLFPDSTALKDTLRLAVPVYTDRGNRVTLTLPVLNNAEQILFLAAGSSKAEVLYEILEGKNRKKYPAGLVKPTMGKVTWLIDTMAAGKLKRGQSLKD